MTSTTEYDHPNTEDQTTTSENQASVAKVTESSDINTAPESVSSEEGNNGATNPTGQMGQALPDSEDDNDAESGNPSSAATKSLPCSKSRL